MERHWQRIQEILTFADDTFAAPPAGDAGLPGARAARGGGPEGRRARGREGPRARAGEAGRADHVRAAGAGELRSSQASPAGEEFNLAAKEESGLEDSTFDLIDT